jgi:hypothetical protein
MSYGYLVLLAVASLGNLTKALDEDATITGLVIGILAVYVGCGGDISKNVNSGFNL